LANHQHQERKLLQACIKGNRQAQYQLYAQHQVYLFGVCMRYAKNRAEAEDILQEGFFKILKDLKQWNGKGEVRAWMRKVIVNTALMHIRKYRKMEFADLEDVQADHTSLKDLSFSQKDRANAVIHLIQSLPDPYQTVFNLRAIEGYSFKEIAEKLGLPRSHLALTLYACQDETPKATSTRIKEPIRTLDFNALSFVSVNRLVTLNCTKSTTLLRLNFKMSDQNNIEDFFNRSLDNFDEQPSEQVWQGVVQRLEVSLPFWKTWQFWSWLTGAAVFGVSLLIYHFNVNQKID
jgi:RNA polymerase sigma-70 factor (ECF subfamily)